MDCDGKREDVGDAACGAAGGAAGADAGVDRTGKVSEWERD